MFKFHKFYVITKWSDLDYRLQQKLKKIKRRPPDLQFLSAGKKMFRSPVASYKSIMLVNYNSRVVQTRK